MPLTRRGHFRIEPLHIRTGDPFGFFEASATVGQGVPSIVYPRVEPLPALAAAGREPRGQPRGAGTDAPDDPARDDRPAVGAGRRASTGSTGGRTARLGEIQVKEFDLEQTADAWIILDLERASRPARR